ncbi:hypothetical protein DL101_16590 [Salmonella enterica subsp. enterica serovar Braenderup]|uniref:Uncharacterized protein n=1 Tax=Salmonella enterica subsp. enterica serovar Braenderup TaxID=149391 RepID=A0A634YWB0_SALET|nr:hypothetical protein [Salmonella enterica subsp. enterica serovar Braenderup]EAP7990950.1 hypothetical protein [Salmonella enterica]ECD0494299.1 hypothetical protein [Salmonella enterica subsp. enterica serovar Bareilly]ELX8021651.1 hypothetical protein [Salmonella enterica subsp. enterica serovar Kentucky]EAQ1000338.1 hypothetical protein [Salmonella enterica]
MRMTSRKKEILSYYEPDSLEWVIGEIGAPPFDVSGIAYLIHGMESFGKRHQLESTRRTLETMVAGGLLEKVAVYEQRQNTTQSSAGAPGVWCNVTRYGLPGKCRIYRDTGDTGVRPPIEGEAIRIDVPA